MGRGMVCWLWAVGCGLRDGWADAGSVGWGGTTRGQGGPRLGSVWSAWDGMWWGSCKLGAGLRCDGDGWLGWLGWLMDTDSGGGRSCADGRGCDAGYAPNCSLQTLHCTRLILLLHIIIPGPLPQLPAPSASHSCRPEVRHALVLSSRVALASQTYWLLRFWAIGSCRMHTNFPSIHRTEERSSYSTTALRRQRRLEEVQWGVSCRRELGTIAGR